MSVNFQLVDTGWETMFRGPAAVQGGSSVPLQIPGRNHKTCLAVGRLGGVLAYRSQLWLTVDAGGDLLLVITITWRHEIVPHPVGMGRSRLHQSIQYQQDGFS